MARNRKRKGDPVHGWLVFNKPTEMTSTQAVGLMRRLFNADKAGHGGTLDPLADGVLPIAFGEATKTSGYAMDAEKSYRFTLAWGASTTTQDREGDVTQESDVRPTRAQIEAILPSFTGEITQIPPKYSAIKVDGQRAYDLAREGEAFELKARTVWVEEISIVDHTQGESTVLEVVCGKGFYIRALARDLAATLGAEGHVSTLTRTRVGNFTLETTTCIDTLKEMDSSEARREVLVPIEATLTSLPQIHVTRTDAAKLRQGQTIAVLPHQMDLVKDHYRARGISDSRLTLVLSDQTALALGDVRAGRFQPSRVFQITPNPNPTGPVN